jgi:hypothetical protein
VAQRLRSGAVPGMDVRTGVVVDALRAADHGVVVTLRSNSGNIDESVVDRIIGLTGFLGDTSLYQLLLRVGYEQVDEIARAYPHSAQ